MRRVGIVMMHRYAQVWLEVHRSASGARPWRRASAPDGRFEYGPRFARWAGWDTLSLSWN
jgi:hypothetical protein